MRLRITVGIAYEYQSRDVFPYAWDVGTREFTAEQVAEMLDDAKHYADPSSTDMDRSTMLIYRRHVERIEKNLK